VDARKADPTETAGKAFEDYGRRMPTRSQVRAGLAFAVAAGSLALPAASSATAPGWSTPHTGTSTNVSTYAAGSNGQGVQLFADGMPPSRMAQMRAIKQNGTLGTSVVVNPGTPGIGMNDLSVNDNGRLIAAWAIDQQNGTGVTNLAATLGARTSLPRTAAVIPTGQLVTDLQTAIASNGTGVVAWVQAPQNAPAGPATVHVARLVAGQAPAATQLASYSGLTVDDVSVGFDGDANPVVTWSAGSTAPNAPGVIGVARGTAAGIFAPAVESPIDTVQFDQLQTFVTTDGGLLAFWLTGSPGQTPVAVRYAQAAATGPFSAAKTVISGASGGAAPAIAANAAGRAAVLFPLASGNGTSLRVVLRTASGTWGSARPLGPSGARRVGKIDAGVDGSGRVVALWDDATSPSEGPTRILAARSSSGSNPLNTYNQVAQRKGDTVCGTPSLALGTSGDGLGTWTCPPSTGAGKTSRIARLTAPG
jgi:hypothetical protein